MTSKPPTTEVSEGPSYPMGSFAAGGSSYTNTVPEEGEEPHTRDATLSDPNTYPHPSQEAPPVYAPPNTHPPGHAPPVGSYGSQQHLVDNAPAHPPPAYSKYTTAAQARWARSSKIAKLLCIGFLVAIVIIIVGVAAGVSLARSNHGPNNNGPNPGVPGSGNCASDAGTSCTNSSDCSLYCTPAGICAC